MRKTKAASEDVEPAEVSRIAGVALGFDPDPFMARGDCRDAMLNVLRTTANWSQFSEQQQRDINAAIDQAAETIIAKLVKAIAAEGKEMVTAKVESLTVKDGLKLNLSAVHDHDSVVILGDLVGKRVTLTKADVGDHDGQRGAAQVDKDQPEMPLDHDDLVNAGDGEPGTDKVTGLIVRDGDQLPQGKAGVNLTTGMIEALPDGVDGNDRDVWVDVREATPEELAAERERTADFEPA